MTNFPPLPPTIRAVNNLPQGEKEQIYRSILPPWLLHEYFGGATRDDMGELCMTCICPPGSRSVELSVRRRPDDRDPLLYLQLADNLNNQIIVLLVVVNDPESPRFDTDVDEQGKPTSFGTNGRNIPAEIAAMKYGLSPGQVRTGLRSFRHSIPYFEDFIRNMGHDLVLIEPLAYHNAISFERYGFNYVYGHDEMVRIHQAFLPEGEYYRRLDGSTPFRQADAWRSVRGRSWAIHDGIMGRPFTGFEMVKRIGLRANVETFPNAVW
jgi:hypothetical protein